MNKNFTPIIIIFTVALLLGIFCIKFLPTIPQTGDSLDYSAIAKNLALGKGFAIKGGVPTAERPPAYPFFLAFIYKMNGSLDAVRIIQFFLLGCTASLIYLIGRSHLKIPNGLSFLAAGTIIFWPYFSIYASLILTETLLVFSLTASLFFLLEFQQNLKSRNAIISGIFFGLLLLVKPLPILFPVWLLVLLWIFKKNSPLSARRLSIFILVIFLVVSPWIIRNFIQFKTFIPITSGATGGPLYNQMLARAFITLDYTEGSTALKPGEATVKTILISKIKNIYLFWNPGAGGENAQDLTQRYPFLKIVFFAYKIAFFAIVFLAFLSLRFFKQKEVFLLWTIIFYFWGLHIILYPYPRYTLPIMPFIILLAFFTLNDLSQNYLTKKA